MKKVLISLVIIVANTVNLSHAYTMCDTTAKVVVVEGERKSDPKYSNTLLIQFHKEDGTKTKCADLGYGYIDLSSPASNGMLAVALSAQARNKMLRMKIDESKTKGNAALMEYLYIID